MVSSELNKEITSLAVLPNDLVAIGTNDSWIYIKDISKNQIVRLFDFNEEKLPILNLHSSPKGYLFSNTKDEIKIWMPTSLTWLNTIYTVSSFLYTLKLLVLPNGYIVTIQGFRTIIIWNPDTGNIVNRLAYHNSDICDLIFMKKNYLASASLDYKVVIWNLNDDSIFNVFTPFNSDSALKLAALPNNDLVVATSTYINVWDISSGSIVKYLSIHSCRVLSLTVLNNGFLVSSFGQTVEVYDTFKGKSVYSLNTQNETVNVLAVLGNGYLIGGTLSGNLMVWNTRDI